MAGTNAMIHLVAALALAGLGYLWVLAKKRLEFLRLITGNGDFRHILADWPDKFIRNIAQSCMIEVSGSCSGKFREPVAIDIRVWQGFFRVCEVRNFQWGMSEQNGQPVLSIGVRFRNQGKPAFEGDWAGILGKSLGFRVDLKEVPESRKHRKSDKD